MSYRKITIGDTEYEYSVGKTHTKIKGFQAVPNHIIATFLNEQNPPFAVTPKMIATYIKDRLTSSVR